MKKSKKLIILFIVILVFTLFLLVTQSSAAALNPDSYKPADVSTSDAQSFFNKTSVILGTITTVGVIVSVVTLMLLGVKYMMGSVEERADYKKAMIPYIIGAILIFATSTLTTIIYNWAQTI